MKRRLILWVPLGLFALFALFAATGLIAPGERTIPSALIGQSVPDFDLPPAVPGRPGLSSASLRRGGPRVVNIFASWCLPCRVEAPQLEAMSARGIPIDGIAIRDREQDLTAFLNSYGNPFSTIGADRTRQVQIELGSAGVPETFVIDGRGIIRYQHIGAIMAEDMPRLIEAYEAAR